jgi:hypothetical protein
MTDSGWQWAGNRTVGGNGSKDSLVRGEGQSDQTPTE